MATAYVTHPDYNKHKMQNYAHPERPERIEAVWSLFKETGMIDRLHDIHATAVSDDAILRVHTQDHLDTFEYIAKQNQMSMYDQDTYALPQSPQIARLSAGGVVNAIDAVLTGDADNALAAVRPPGHHATPTRAMGFCLLSNIAIGARHAQATYESINKVMIVDFDVHHGNGTQDVFYDDKSVLFLSTHQHPFYPGTGKLDETGTGDAIGTTINVPLSAGHGDDNYARIYTDIVWKAARRYQPDLLLISAGYDAHFVDPLAQMNLSLTGYTHLCRELKAMADDLCDGNIVFVMEGGYDLKAISHGMLNIAHVLLGHDTISDPYGSGNPNEPDVAPLIEQVQAVHNL